MHRLSLKIINSTFICNYYRFIRSGIIHFYHTWAVLPGEKPMTKKKVGKTIPFHCEILRNFSSMKMMHCKHNMSWDKNISLCLTAMKASHNAEQVTTVSNSTTKYMYYSARYRLTKLLFT